MLRSLVVWCVVVFVIGCDGVVAEGEPEGGEGEGEGELPPPPPPPATCAAPIEVVSTTNATIVGDGTPASCTAAALTAALATADIVTFSCGTEPITIETEAEIVVTRDLVVDGGRLVTLSGSDEHRLFRVDSTFDVDTPRLTLQRLGLVGGHADGDGSDTTHGGGAVLRLGGSLDVIDCDFSGNSAPPSGQDVAGGAISSIGGGVTTIVNSLFTGNRASNGGAIGNLGNGLVVVDSGFFDNAATGTGGNPGNGGNGGTISVDGEDRTIDFCGVAIFRSDANAFGGAFFRVAYNGEPTTMHDVVIDDAVIPDRAPSMGGALYVQNSAFTLSSSSIMNSSASAAGGAYIGPGSTVRFINASFIGNTASSSLAGALFLDGVVGGEITFSSFIDNAAPGPVAFGGAVTGDASRVSLRSSLFIDNSAGNGFNPITCTTSFLDGADSFQFPVVRAGNGGGDGGSDDPGALCAPNITVEDIELQPCSDNVCRPGANAVVVDVGCDVDASGRERPTPCASGAAEP